MLDFTLAGPIICILAMADVEMHIYLDAVKRRRRQDLIHTDVRVGRLTFLVVMLTTFLLFSLTLIIVLAWAFSFENLLMTVLCPLTDPPLTVWGAGLVIFSLGVVLHGWSRVVRQEMATSWEMSTSHRLVTDGPYRVIRHPSYLSYFMTFCGMFLMLPTPVTLFMLTGIPAYYSVAVTEERLLILHFGDVYREYMSRTGRFIPRVRIHREILVHKRTI